MKNTQYVLLAALVFNLGVSVPQAVAAPKIISNCMTITEPGSYVLDENLKASGDCLVVAADFVTIDFAGFTISGDGTTGEGVTDNNAARRGIVIRNGAIQQFRNGIFLFDTIGSAVERMQVSDNKIDGIDFGSGNRVSNTIVHDNGNIGISISGGSTVSHNVVKNNASVGIRVSCPSNVVDNTATTNGVNLQFLGASCNDTNNVAP
jgi:hypothetical protein